MQHINKLLLILFVGICLGSMLSCDKKLPSKPDNYDTLFGTIEKEITKIEIPCESDLKDNHFETSAFIGMDDQFSINSIYESRSVEYIAHAYNSRVQLIFEIEKDPSSKVGIKKYEIGPESYATENSMKIYLKYPNFHTTTYYYPAKEGEVYVKYSAEAMELYICDAEFLASDFSNNTFTLKGKIIYEYED